MFNFYIIFYLQAFYIFSSFHFFNFILYFQLHFTSLIPNFIVMQILREGKKINIIVPLWVPKRLVPRTLLQKNFIDASKFRISLCHFFCLFSFFTSLLPSHAINAIVLLVKSFFFIHVQTRIRVPELTGLS